MAEHEGSIIQNATPLGQVVARLTEAVVTTGPEDDSLLAETMPLYMQVLEKKPLSSSLVSKFLKAIGIDDLLFTPNSSSVTIISADGKSSVMNLGPIR